MKFSKTVRLLALISAFGLMGGCSELLEDTSDDDFSSDFGTDFGPFYDVSLIDLPSTMTQGPIVPFTRTSATYNHTEIRLSNGEKVESDINFLAVDYVQLAILPQDKADHNLALGEMTTAMKTLTQHQVAVRESQSRRTEINRRVIDDANDIKDYMKNLLRKIH